ncbi:MAG: hypothetical protein QOI53_4016 [Verrucomicrobiota bacterium]|nr:hypothetical protein [Verrucomicrobiota bacterium]
MVSVVVVARIDSRRGVFSVGKTFETHKEIRHGWLGDFRNLPGTVKAARDLRPEGAGKHRSQGLSWETT